MTRLHCNHCDLTCRPAAIARDPTLAAGATCRRCGGTLRWSPDAPVRSNHTGVQAVRSVISQHERETTALVPGPRD